MKAAKLGLLSVFLMQLLVNCSGNGKAVYLLPPDDKQFLSEVRYIISKKEIKLFKNTPQAERKQLIEEFWKIRDPDPTTEENEFRDEYFKRIEQANRLFREGSSGWLSDRGRIYILLGEPERRDAYPSGYSFYDPPVEIWYYGFFPIIFIDYEREGIYRLEPGSARKLSMINVAQMRLKPEGIIRDDRAFDFILKANDAGQAGAAKLLLYIPYKTTFLSKNEQTSTYQTRLKLTVIVTNAANQAVLQKEETHFISFPAEAMERLAKFHIIEFPLQLSAGNYSVLVTLENETDKKRASKQIKIKF